MKRKKGSSVSVVSALERERGRDKMGAEADKVETVVVILGVDDDEEGWEMRMREGGIVSDRLRGSSDE